MTMPPEGAQSSEIQRIIEQLRGFRPRQSVRILTGDDDQPVFLKVWALTRLLTWAVLDQRPGKRRRKPTAEKSATDRRLAFRTRNAKQIGHLVLAFLLDRRFQGGSVKPDDETLHLMLWIFMKSGGFGGFVQGRGARGFLSAAKRANRELGYVYRIVVFLCRYKKHIGNGPKFDIDTAKRFVELNDHEHGSTYGLSKISKIWEKYKQAAPYIFAFYGYFSSALERAKSPHEAVDFLEKLASNKTRLARIMGRAAYVADVLHERARNVRLRDFKQITRVEP